MRARNRYLVSFSARYDKKPYIINANSFKEKDNGDIEFYVHSELVGLIKGQSTVYVTKVPRSFKLPKADND